MNKGLGMRWRGAAVLAVLTRCTRALFGWLLMAIPFVGGAAVSSVEAGVSDERPAIVRLDQIRHQLRLHDDQASCSESGHRHLAQWYNWPNWNNWNNWGNWRR